MNKSQVTIYFFANSIFYCENFKANLIASLYDAGYKVHFIVFDVNHAQNSDLVKKNDIIVVRFKDIFWFYKRFYTKLQSGPALVLSYNTKANLFCGVLRIFRKFNWIMGVSGLGTLGISKKIYHRFLKKTYQYLSRNANVVIVQNQDDHSFFKKDKFSTNRIVLIPGSGVDLQKFKYVNLYGSRKVKFLMVARLIAEKGVLEYIDAVELLSKQIKIDNVQFFLIGDTSLRNPSALNLDFVEERCKKVGIQYLGFRTDINAVLKNIDVLVLPSYREGCPKAVLEAFATGRPAVVADSPGCRDLMADGANGWLCKPRDPMSLKENLIEIITCDFEIIRSKGLNARRFVEEYHDVRRVDLQTMQLIQNQLPQK